MHRPGVVLSLDNVPVALPIARAGSRSLAAAVDYFLWFLLMVVWSLLVVLVLALAGSGIGGSEGKWLLVLYTLSMFLIDWAYFAGQEIVLRGQTLGKRVVGLRVVTQDGGRPGRLALLVRNLVRLVDLVLAMPLLILDPQARRLGDWLAGTLVVHAEREAAGFAVRRLPRGFGLEEAALIEGLLARAQTLEPARTAALAERVLHLIERSDPQFLAGAPELLDPLTRLTMAVRPGAAEGVPSAASGGGA